MQPRALDRDVDLARRPGNARHIDEPLVQVEEAEEVDEVALEKAPAAQVLEFLARKVEIAECADLVPDALDVGGEVDIGVAAAEAVFDLRLRKMMQDHLHHRELVEVGIEQGRDDHRRLRFI